MESQTQMIAREKLQYAVRLNELICELAYERRMTWAEAIAYQRENDCGSLETGGKRPDPKGLNKNYDAACAFILEQAGAGSISLYACPPKNSAADRYPKSFGDYQVVPKEVFIAQYSFGLCDPPVLWANGESPFTADWFFPVVKTGDAAKLLKQWRKATTLSDAEIRSILEEEIRNSGYLPIRKAQTIVRLRENNVTINRIRKLLLEVQGPQKQGPKGPRKKCVFG